MSDYQLATGETVLRQIRRHWINVLPIFVGSALIGLIILGMIYALARYSDAIAKLVPLGLVSLLLVALAAVALMTSVLAYWIYTQNRLVLTNQHIIQITQLGLFNRRVSQLSLAKVQDVSSTTNGLLATIFGFGDITVETAGEEENFSFHQLADPHTLCQDIMQAHETLVKNPANDAL